MGVHEVLLQFARRARSFADIPKFAWHTLQFAWMRARKQTTDIRLRFGDNAYSMRIQPLGPREGARGIFVFRERYEPLLDFGSKFLKPGDIALDLGANQGIFCCAFAAAVGSTGRVIAVEPIPRQVERLRTNITINGFGQCEILQKAISNGTGVAKLSLAAGDTSASILAEERGVSIAVETIGIDEIVRQCALEKVDFIKLDIEGAELLALAGASNTLRRFRPTLCLEAGNPEQFQEVRALLVSMDYQIFLFDRAGGLEALTDLAGPEANVIALPSPGWPESRTGNQSPSIPLECGPATENAVGAALRTWTTSILKIPCHSTPTLPFTRVGN